MYVYILPFTTIIHEYIDIYTSILPVVPHINVLHTYSKYNVPASIDYTAMHYWSTSRASSTKYHTWYNVLPEDT
jgi:hypothetical protein